MTLVRSVEWSLIRALGFVGERVLMRVAARDFVRRQGLAAAHDAAIRALDDHLARPWTVEEFAALKGWRIRDSNLAFVALVDSEMVANTIVNLVNAEAIRPRDGRVVLATDIFTQHTQHTKQPK